MDRKKRRQVTSDEIVDHACALVADGEDLSLRGVAGRMGVTAPALYRYVSSHRELHDLVAFEIDRRATASFRAAAEAYPSDDPGARIVAASVAFRRWALTHPREFALVFANPVAEPGAARAEEFTVVCSSDYLTGLVRAVWERYDFPLPSLDEMDPSVTASILNPQVSIDDEGIAEEHRGLLWVYVQAWVALYGIVTLEVFGHLDPRLTESGALFVDQMATWVDRFDMADERERLLAIMDAELGRH